MHDLTHFSPVLSPVPGRQLPRGLPVAGLVAAGQREHRLGSYPLGRRQEVCDGDSAAVLQRYARVGSYIVWVKTAGK